MTSGTIHEKRILRDAVRVAAIGDIHCKLDSRGRLRQVFDRIAAEADILLVCGDITHYGLNEESAVFVEEAARALDKIPVLGVLGNHDFESGKQDLIWQQLSDAGITMLDGNNREIYGIGFTGVKGFGGGFGRQAIQPLGEPALKNFVREVVEEMRKLEMGLASLRSGPKIVAMHYAPIIDTLAGESLEMFPFLGSSSLEEPLNRFAVTAVFHGHAHKGFFRGKTSSNIPVYNVSVQVLKQHFPDRLPYFVLEIPLEN
jgi:Icc-related predicted phosphoesterase